MSDDELDIHDRRAVKDLLEYMMHITWQTLQSLLVPTVDNHLVDISSIVLLGHVHPSRSLCRFRLFRTGLVLYGSTRIGIGLLVIDRR